MKNKEDLELRQQLIDEGFVKGAIIMKDSSIDDGERKTIDRLEWDGESNEFKAIFTDGMWNHTDFIALVK